MANRVAVSTTSRRVPKFAVLGTPAMEAVPVLVILPRANGVPALGRTRMFCQVKEQVVPDELDAVTVKVS